MEDREAINRARALYYGLFASLFAFVKEDRFKGLKESLEILKENPLEDNSKKALENMYSILSSQGLEFVQDEFDAVFYDLSSDPVPTTASFYEEERDDGKKRLLMVNFVLKSKYRRDSENFSDLEDDIGFIFSFLSRLIEDEAKGDEKAKELEIAVFEKVLNEFVDDFIENVYMHENSAFYQEAALLLKVFVEFERVFLDIRRPKEKIKVKKEKKINISDAEAARRLENKRKKSEEIGTVCELEEGGDVEDDV
ncbi:MAG: hypothetical protein GXO12_06810 [Epsilonproteobacteria bacterium]|jgi:TorA maturation chaperone TorD|nr:hypothetical protein [Campylobacterota bacterium]